jgi:hypothetical protein
MLIGTDNYYYIGSTVTELANRLSHHIQSAKKYTERKIYKHFNELLWNNVSIELIVDYPCNNRNELLKEENEYIRKALLDPFCLNINHTLLTQEEQREKYKNYRDNHKEEKKKYRSEHMEEHRAYNKNYVVNHKEIVLQKQKEYRDTHKEELKEYFKKYAQEHKEEKKEYKKKYTAENKDLLVKKSKEFREKNKDKITEKGKKYFQENRDELIKKMKEYREKDPEKTKARHAKYLENRKQKLKEIGTISHQCECGGKYIDKHKERHTTSKKHARFLETPM